MTSFFFKFVFLNSLLRFFANFEPSLGAADNDGGAALRGMVVSRSNRTHGWQLVGGRAVNNADFNFQALIDVYNEQSVFIKTCTGTIVSDLVIVTAANCVTDLNQDMCPLYEPSAFSVYVGSTNYQNLKSGVTPKKVTVVRKHENFGLQDSGNKYIKFRFDIGILKLDEALNFDDNIGKITLAINSVTESLPGWELSYKLCTAYGLATSYDSPTNPIDVPLQLFSADMKLVPFQKCLDSWRNKGFEATQEYHICSTGYSGSVCMTNTGGGLFCEDSNVKYFVGVATLTVNCGSESVPSVFTRVDSAIDFILQTDSTNEKESPSRSSGVFIHKYLLAQYYGAPLTSVFLLTIVFKSVFYRNNQIELDIIL